MATSNKPETVFRIGSVSASVFIREVGQGDTKRTIRSVNIQKRYLDGDQPKYTSNFGLAELPQLIRVLTLVQLHLEEHEAEFPTD